MGARLRIVVTLLVVVALAGAAVGAAGGAARPSAGASSARPAIAAGSKKLSVKPRKVRRGRRIRVRGRGWGSHHKVSLYVARPDSDAYRPDAVVRTGRHGRFHKRFRISRRASPGRWVLLACRRDCAIKRTRGFRIVR